MVVSELINRLLVICQRGDVSPDEVDVLFRTNYDSDEYDVNYAHEDLYDEETNNILTSIMLLEDDREVV
jgi:hypothetical protein|tara:strand:- start:52 stop:258 length:207 start_codon:yes stop_codon:yes gene_type:complete